MKILILDGTVGFTPTCLAERATGGIATSLSLLPRLWAKAGHEVGVYHHECEQSVDLDGVHWMNAIATENFTPDAVIYNRNFIEPRFLAHYDKAVNIVWLHDIPDYRITYGGCLPYVDSIVALSEYHKRSFADFWKLDPRKIEVIPNGVDRSVFYSDNLPRDRHLFLHASAPIKGGLELLNYVFGEMRKIDPLFTLEMYCSQSLHKLDNAEYTTKLNRLKAVGVTVLDPIPQAQLADRLRRAHALLMPNTYPENCSNIMLQALACHTPVVSSRIGSAAEWINEGQNGELTDTYPHDLFWFTHDYLEKVKATYATGAWKFGEIASWQQISEAWLDHLRRLIRCAATTVAVSDGGKTSIHGSDVRTAEASA